MQIKDKTRFRILPDVHELRKGDNWEKYLKKCKREDKDNKTKKPD